jgi:hypothetical protein
MENCKAGGEGTHRRVQNLIPIRIAPTLHEAQFYQKRSSLQTISI